MNIKIVLLYDEGRQEIGSLTEHVARQYVERHGYELVVYRKLFRPDLPAAFSTMKAIATEMEANPQVDWFMRLDADSIIVDQSFKLETILADAKPFLGTHDQNGLCTGVCWVKNSGWSARLLHTLDFLGELDPKHWNRFDLRNTWEQNTLKCLIRYFPQIADHTGAVPETIVQNPRSAFNPNAFMMHYWSNSGLAMIADKMREVIANGWSRKAFYQYGESL